MGSSSVEKQRSIIGSGDEELLVEVIYMPTEIACTTLLLCKRVINETQIKNINNRNNKQN